MKPSVSFDVLNATCCWSTLRVIYALVADVGPSVVHPVVIS